MRLVVPTVALIARPAINWVALQRHLVDDVGAPPNWLERRAMAPSGEILIEFMGRKCYRSFEAGLNPNISKVRTDRGDYFENILSSRHGSVLAHAHYSFVFHNVSRVFTHEIVRHSAGTDISQESLRYVRLDHIPFWEPEWALQDEELHQRNKEIIAALEAHQKWMAQHFGLENPKLNFAEKKAKTSYMRRFAPEGLATSIGMTFNVRALRHVLEMRYSEHAEEEMLAIMPQLFAIMKSELPLLFNDYAITAAGLETPYRKV